MFELYHNNISLRRAITCIIEQDLDNAQRTNIYKKFINKFYNNKYSDDVAKENCPNDMRYINVLNDQIWKIKGGRRKLRTKADRCAYFKEYCVEHLPVNIGVYTILLLMLPDLEVDVNVGYFDSINKERLEYSKEKFYPLLNKVVNLLGN